MKKMKKVLILERKNLFAQTTHEESTSKYLKDLAKENSEIVRICFVNSNRISFIKERERLFLLDHGNVKFFFQKEEERKK